MLRLGMTMALVGLVACGSDVVLDGPTGSTSTSSSSSSSTATSSAVTTGAGGGGGMAGTGGAGAGGAPPTAEYAACFWAGGLDHIVVKKLDVANGVCIRLHAAWPGGPGQHPDVTGNDGWAVSDISLTPDLTDCLTPTPGGPLGTSAEPASGTLYVPPAPPYPPATMDLSVVATFNGLPPNIPSTHTIEATGLPLASCN